MARYFESFPKIQYDNQTVVNLMTRIKILDSVKKQNSVYHPFTILDGESPQKIAFDYYGSTDYVWLIFLANNIVDPYYDWPLSTFEFEAFLKKKYGSLQAAQSTIVHYKKNPSRYWVNIYDPNSYYAYGSLAGDTSRYTLVEVGEEILMSVESYTLNPDAAFSPVYADDWEFEQNEARRNIRLIDASYARTMDKELKAVLSST